MFGIWSFLVRGQWHGIQVCSIYLAQPGPPQDWWALGVEELWLGGATIAPPCVWYKGPRKFRPVPTALQSLQPFSASINHQKPRCQHRFFFIIVEDILVIFLREARSCQSVRSVPKADIGVSQPEFQPFVRM